MGNDATLASGPPLGSLGSTAAAVVVGALSWSAAEYGLHRFAMHSLRGRGLASREHLAHHADVTYFSPASKKLLSAAGTTAVAWPAVAAVAGRRVATAFSIGMVTTYFGYEIAHRRIHTHAPATRWGRWARRHHLRHHFGAPMRNFGVTSGVWDAVFGTTDDPGVVSVPRRMAPVWLLDDDGEVRPEYAGEYRAAGTRTRDAAQTAEDRAAAFANLAPTS